MSGFNFGTPTSSAPTFSLALGTNTAATGTSGATGFSFGNPTPSSTTPALQFNAPASTATTTFGTPAATGGFSFGSTGGLTLGTPASTQPSAFKPGGLTFGSPATTQAVAPTLGGFGTPATTPSTGLTFGTTPAANQLSFGATPAPTTQSLTFGTSFGTTTAASQPTLSFGSAPTTAQPLSFGTTPATTQQTLSFGSVAATVPAATTPQPALSFGLSTPAPAPATGTATAGTGFSLGTPAAATTTAATGLSLGLGTQATAIKPGLTFGAPATTTTPLFNFSGPKTTAATGFSLTVTGAGSSGGGLFPLSTSSAPATTTSAPSVFKGLGGVDTTTTQGSGQKDPKSVKENIVNPEIMQTLDTFKQFVKQQKSLSCEVSRAPVKPMHKVTEDTDALRQLLTSVGSALQRNRTTANKLKCDTTQCLSLCEMAQRTHDTPPGLQNDNIAPLEFFIQLVSKYERDIQVLRQEIDNTEKHVNSLSYPAILTPQELSIALRRLHDSFVALAGRLQSAHAGVIAQKERHLGLRRHFLKDTTNVFEDTSHSRSPATSQCKPPPLCRPQLPMPGPTPFSSLGGVPNISLLIGQDKPVTFATGQNPLSGWGSSTMSPLNANPVAALLQPSAAVVLAASQPAEMFQLSKPPPGNKRGKR